jgi:hypothetical protein
VVVQLPASFWRLMMSMVLGFGAEGAAWDRGVATPVALASAAAMKQTAVSRETTIRIDTPSMKRRHRATGHWRLSRERLAKSMSQVDSRYNGCLFVD